jgi:hypothetical protein
MAFGKKEKVYLRARVRRTTPLMDLAFAIVLGGISGVYIFNDTFRRWQLDEIQLAQKQQQHVADFQSQTRSKE